KREAAHVIHELSPARCGGPFREINSDQCGSEESVPLLFGRLEKGKGGISGGTGAVHSAAGGTLFIPTIDRANASCQAQLAEMLQTGKHFRLGSTRAEPSNIRLIVSSEVELADKARELAFRADLLNELAVDPIEFPPLSEHREDIPYLVSYYSCEAWALAGS